MKKNLKTILTSGTLLLGSLALFAGCGSSGGSDFIKNIQKEVNWILNNNKPNKQNTNGIVKPNTLFSLSQDTADAIKKYTSDGTAINNDKVNLNVKQVLGYYEYQISNNSYGVETSVLVNDSKVTKPTKATFDNSEKHHKGLNFANNFILNFSYLVNKDNKVTQINDATKTDYFNNNQSVGNSIDNYVDINDILIPIKVNDKFDIKNPAFNPNVINKNTKGALFVDQRTSYVNGTSKDSNTYTWSLPNAAYTAAVQSKSKGIETIRDMYSAEIQQVKNSSLVIKIGYTENLTIVSGSNQKGVIYGLNADKLSFNEFFLENSRNPKKPEYVLIIIPKTKAPAFVTVKHFGNLAFWLDKVNFNVSSGPYLGYSVSSVDLIK